MSFTWPTLAARPDTPRSGEPIPAPHRFLPMKRGLIGTSLALTLLLAAGCGSPQQPSATPTPTTSAPTSQTPEPKDGEPTETEPTEEESAQMQEPTASETIENNSPTNAPEGDHFSFEDAAEFSDGLSIEIAFTLMDKAKPTDTGAEATDQDMAVVVVRIDNGTPEEFFTDTMTIAATYGDGQIAKPIIDSSGELQSTFSGTVPIGEESQQQFAFAIPVDSSDQVQITINPNDEIHDPIIFSGAIDKSAG